MSTDTKDRDQASEEEMSFDEMLEQSFAEQSSKSGSRLSPGDRVDATVVRVGKSYVFLDLGARTEGLLTHDQVTDEDGQVVVEVGQRLPVYVTGFRDGAIVCGLRMGSGGIDQRPDSRQAALDALREAFDAGMPVEGTVKESIKGGFAVTVLGARAFCPISQISDEFCDAPEEHLNQTYDFEITKLEEGGRNIVVSRRRLLEREAADRAREAWKRIEVGGVYKGVVTSVRPYGAFVDIGGIEGLLHVSELSYDRVSDPGELVQKGQELEVSIKEIDEEKGRISLSLKALMQDPWDEVAGQLKVNQVVAGKVSRIARFGAFVQLVPGVEGLVHLSEMGQKKRINTPREVVSEGQEIAVRILEINPVAKRISLTMNTEDDEEGWSRELARSQEASPGRGMGTLGDLMKAKLKK